MRAWAQDIPPHWGPSGQLRHQPRPGRSWALAKTARRRLGWMAVYDAIIVGAGHNGLVTAAYLARAGWRVLVLERRRLVGGACVTEEVFPGYHVSPAAY